MDSNDDEEQGDNSHPIVFLDPRALTSTSKMKKMVESLEQFFNIDVVRVSSSLLKKNIPMSITTGSVFGFYDTNDVFVFGLSEFSLLEPDPQVSFQGENNAVQLVHKCEMKAYLSQFESILDETLPTQYVYRFPKFAFTDAEKDTTYLEAFIAIVASYAKVGPSIYGISKGPEHIAWLMEKGDCDLSQTMLKLSSIKEAEDLAKSSIDLLLRISKHRLFLFDIKLENIIDMGANSTDRLFAIDFDPRFTIFGSKSLSDACFVINATLLLSSTNCWYRSRNKFVTAFINAHTSVLNRFFENWDDSSTITDLYNVFHKKFFNSNAEFIGDFQNAPESSKDSEKENADLLIICKGMKNMFREFANNYVFSALEPPMYDNAHFIQVLNWLGVTRTEGCHNEKLTRMAAKNLPENWTVKTSMEKSQSRFTYENPLLKMQMLERPPRFDTLEQQLHWYMKHMLNRHSTVDSSKSKHHIARDMLDTMLSSSNQWFLKKEENTSIKNILNTKLEEFAVNAQRKKNEIDVDWSTNHLKTLESLE